jgi:hypothetical protein
VVVVEIVVKMVLVSLESGNTIKVCRKGVQAGKKKLHNKKEMEVPKLL